MSVAVVDLKRFQPWVEAADENGDGELTKRELETALRTPEKPILMSAEAVSRLERMVGAKPRLISKLTPWARNMARLADANNDRKTDSAELQAYIAQNRVAGSPGLNVLTTQRLNVVREQLSKPDARVFFRSHYWGVYDAKKKIPSWIAYTMNANDNRLRVDVPRKPAFRGDLGFDRADIAYPSWYAISGYDMGHHMPYEDYSDPESASNSWVLSNMAPQTARLNQQGWKVLESGIRQLVDVTGGSAEIVTGNLFEGEIKYIGPDKDLPNGHRRVAVPTHYYKAVLLRLPDGTKHTFAWVMPNRTDVPTTKPDIGKLFNDGIVSVASIERTTGETFFDSVAKSNAKGLAPVLKKLVDSKVLTAENLAPGGACGDLGDIWPSSLVKPA